MAVENIEKVARRTREAISMFYTFYTAKKTEGRT